MSSSVSDSDDIGTPLARIVVFGDIAVAAAIVAIRRAAGLDIACGIADVDGSMRLNAGNVAAQQDRTRLRLTTGRCRR